MSNGVPVVRMSRVLIEYENGLSIAYEHEALEQWAEQFVAGQIARAQLQNLAQQGAQAPDTTEPQERPSNVRSLRDVLSKRADSE